MYTEENRMLRMLDDVAFRGFTASTLPSDTALYNDLAAAMIAFGRKILNRPAAAAGEPVDHFADEVSFHMLLYLDRLLPLNDEQRLRYFYKSAKNAVKTYWIQNNRSAYICRLSDDAFWNCVPAQTDMEQNLIHRELIAEFFACAAAKLTLLEFVCFFCSAALGMKPRETESLLQNQGASFVNWLTVYLADCYRVSPSVFDKITERNQLKNDITARAITQAALRAKAKMKTISSRLYRRHAALSTDYKE